MIPTKRNARNKTIFGFDNIKDFTNTFFSIDYYGIVLVSSIIGGLTSFITTYVYPSSHAIYTLLALILFDTFSGVYRALKTKTFTSERLPRVLLVLISYISLLSLSFHLAQDQPVFAWVPSFLYFGFTTTLFISIIENISDLGLLPKGLLNKILDYFKTKQDEKQAGDLEKKE